MMSSLSAEKINTIKALLSTDENKKILASLSLDADKTKKALSDASSGDMTAAREIIAKLSSSPDGARLIASILSSLGGRGNG